MNPTWKMQGSHQGRRWRRMQRYSREEDLRNCWSFAHYVTGPVCRSDEPWLDKLAGPYVSCCKTKVYSKCVGGSSRILHRIIISDIFSISKTEDLYTLRLWSQIENRMLLMVSHLVALWPGTNYLASRSQFLLQNTFFFFLNTTFFVGLVFYLVRIKWYIICNILLFLPDIDKLLLYILWSTK